MLRAILLGILAATAVVLPATATAATINVTTTTDEFAAGSRCSLREAISSANSDSLAQAQGCTKGSGADLILVPAGRFRITRAAPPSNPPIPTSEDNNVFGDFDIIAPVSIVHSGTLPAIVDDNVSGERVFHNLAAGGTTIQGLTITDGSASADPENRGGGILNEGSLTVANTTIEGNSAVFGGGLSTEGSSTATLTNVTISGNRAFEDGGGVSVETGGTVNLNSVTVASNTADADHSGGGDGGGVFASTSGGGGVAKLRNTLLAGNRDEGGEAHDCAKLGGTIASLGHNLVGNANGCDWQQGPGDVLNQSARLLSLSDNGGPTPTQAVKKISPAIDKGASCPSNDQRGVKRRLGGRCDIGAWELARCQGVVINRVGTNAPELIVGTSRADGILALGGADTLRGLAGNDGLCGGTANDSLDGGPGNDSMDGGPGRDRCVGGAGRNRSVACELPRKGR
jgi:CSLREA domain-containing protein